MTARVFLHPRLTTSQVAYGAFEAGVQERGFDLTAVRVVFRRKYFELCRLISQCDTSAVYEQMDGIRFTKGVVASPDPVRAA